MISGLKIKPFLLLVFCLFWISCSQNDQLPHGILPVNRMSGIMLDLQIAKAYNYSFIPGQDTLDYPEDREERLKILYQQIFILHHTDTAHFFKSFRYYSTHPDWLKKVYDQMKDSLKHKQDVQQFLVQKNRKEQEKRLHTKENNWKKVFQTWHAFSDSVYQQCSRPGYLSE